MKHGHRFAYPLLTSMLLLLLAPSCLKTKTKKNDAADAPAPAATASATQDAMCAQEGRFWEEALGKCIDPKPHCLLTEGSQWDEKTSKCLSAADLCVAQKNPSQWRNGACITAEKACRDDKGEWKNDRCFMGQEACGLRGAQFILTKDGECRAMTFVELCQAPAVEKQADIKAMLSLLLQRAQTNSCSAAATWLSQQTSLSFFFRDEATPRIRSVVPLSGFTNLTQLYLPSQEIEDISPLGTLHNLEVLSLERNPNLSDISALSNLTKLRKACLGGNKIYDLGPLANLKSLTLLSLYNNQIPDLSPLAGLTQLVTLHINNNAIRSLFPLRELISLQDLNVEANPIYDERTPATCPTGLDTVHIIQDFCMTP